MFIHLNIFKRKEEKYDAGFSELTRKNRVEKGSRRPHVRPRTAPGSLELPAQALQSIQHDIPLVYEPIRSPAPFYAAARLPTPRDEFPRPPLRRSISSASCAIRNPFRTETSESVATLSNLSEWSSESIDVIPGTVPSHTPMRRMTPPCVAPQKAVIFTQSGPPSESDGTSSGPKPSTTPISLTRSRSLDNSNASSGSAPIRPPLRRVSHEDILTSKCSSRRVY